MDETTDKVVEPSVVCEAKINASDTSIALRLPSKKPGERPVIVRFARRAEKPQLPRNKKALSNKLAYEIVEVFEELTAPRVRFFNILKTDPRVSSAWTCQGTIYFV